MAREFCLKTHHKLKGWEVVGLVNIDFEPPVRLPPVFYVSKYVSPPENLKSFNLKISGTQTNRASIQTLTNFLTTNKRAAHFEDAGNLYYIMPSSTFESIKIAYAKVLTPVVPETVHTTFSKAEAGGIHPRYLQTASEVHAPWALGGCAELIDNSLDAKSKKLFINYVAGDSLRESSGGDAPPPMLDILDDGVGMNHEEILNMLSFGHDEEPESFTRVGKFGAGFKTGTMRMCKDVVVMTKTKTTQSVALLSQTSNKGNSVLFVPVLTWRLSDFQYDASAHSVETAETYKRYIYSNCPFLKNEMAVQNHFHRITNTGTLIMMYNITPGTLDFTSDEHDVRIPKIGKVRNFIRRRIGMSTDDVPMDYSLRAYLEVIYVDPKMTITLRGVRVASKPLLTTLQNKKIETEDFVVELPDETKKSVIAHITLGFNPIAKEKGLGGFMFYWHERLIKAYHRVGSMVHNTDAMNGFIGIVSCNQLEPLNHKQDFNMDVVFLELEQKLANHLEHYWYEVAKQDQLVLTDDPNLEVDKTWIRCDMCDKWREVDQATADDFAERPWFCRFNSDTRYKTCQSPQAPYDDQVNVSASIGGVKSQNVPSPEPIFRNSVKQEKVTDASAKRTTTFASPKAGSTAGRSTPMKFMGSQGVTTSAEVKPTSQDSDHVPRDPRKRKADAPVPKEKPSKIKQWVQRGD